MKLNHSLSIMRVKKLQYLIGVKNNPGILIEPKIFPVAKDSPKIAWNQKYSQYLKPVKNTPATIKEARNLPAP